MSSYPFISSPLNRAGRFVRSFARREEGATAVVFAIAAIPAMMFVGVAVDMANAARYKSNLQAAVDGAVISGTVTAQTLTSAELATGGTGVTKIKTTVENHIRSQYVLPKSASFASIATTVDLTNGKISTTAQVTAPNFIMKMFGRPTNAVKAQADSAWGSGKAEVVLAIDTTYSMAANNKITGAQTAANQLIDTLYALPAASNGGIKMGIVSFDQFVNVGTTYRGASWLKDTSAISTPATYCYDTYPNAKYGSPIVHNDTCYSDGVPYSCSWTEWPVISYGKAVRVCDNYTSTSDWYGCVGTRNYPADLTDTVSISDPVPGLRDTWCAAPFQRLTTSAATMKSNVSALYPHGETYIAPGLLWAWRLLSPNAPFSDGVAYGTKDTKKYIILMTDGANTYAPNYPSHWSNDVSLANSLTAQTCTAIKAKGISIVAVAFAVTDTAIKNTLKNCATTYADYYDAIDVAAMLQAWQAIGQKISGIRVAK